VWASVLVRIARIIASSSREIDQSRRETNAILVAHDRRSNGLDDLFNKYSGLGWGQTHRAMDRLIQVRPSECLSDHRQRYPPLCNIAVIALSAERQQAPRIAANIATLAGLGDAP
jgi:hypothetical protein